MAGTKEIDDRLDVVEQIALKLKRAVADVTKQVGPQGERGLAGPPGVRGPQGQPGKDGALGARGLQGERGLVGPQGERGLVGPQGEQGKVGPQGPRGEQGLRGPQGERGLKGDAGQRGIQGQVGSQGLAGPRGLQGEPGRDGAAGRDGVDGRDGLAGLDGRDGERGLRGERGERGPEGPQGIPGADVDEAEVRALRERLFKLEEKQKKYVFERPVDGPWRGPMGFDGPAGPAGGAGTSTFEADCLATDVIDHCVYVTGPSVLAIAQVTRVDPKVSGLTKPAIGIITAKSTVTRCTVTISGIVAVAGVVLTPGVPHWVGADGKPTPTLPTPDPAGKIACQIIGTAIDATRLIVNPERRPVIRTDP